MKLMTYFYLVLTLGSSNFLFGAGVEGGAAAATGEEQGGYDEEATARLSEISSRLLFQEESFTASRKIKKLLNEGADPSCVFLDPMSREGAPSLTLLHLLAHHGNYFSRSVQAEAERIKKLLVLIRAILQKAPDLLTKKNSLEETPLEHAMEHYRGDIGMIKALQIVMGEE